MALHLFRPHADTHAPTPPVGASGRQRAAVAVLWVLARLAALSHQLPVRRALHICLMVLALVVQAALLLTTAYLCDLALSLMELWADLARKHLELTL